MNAIPSVDNNQVQPALLFVDDDPNVLKSLRRLFHNEKYRIFLAACGAEGLEILKQLKVDLIISDMRMPAMSGAEFFTQVYALWPETVRILLTGYSDLQSTIDAVNKGRIYSHCNKPWNDEELKLLVRNALEQKYLREEQVRLSTIVRVQNDELKILNEHLEERVEQRTAELSNTLQQLDQTNTSLKHQEEQLRRLNYAYAVLCRCNQTLIHATNEEDFIYDFCSSIVTSGHYLASWIDIVEADAEPQHLLKARASYQLQVKNNKISHLGFDPNISPAKCVLEQEASVICRSIKDDHRFFLWRDTLVRMGCQTVICLLIKAHDRILGVLSICADEEDAFADQEFNLLEELVNDLAFGLVTLQSQAVKDELEKTLLLRNQAIEAARNGIIITDARQPGNPLVYANPAFKQITGYELTDTLDSNFSFLNDESHDQTGLEAFNVAIRQRQSGHAIFRNHRKDGTLFWNELNIAPVKNASGEVTHFVGIIDDITEFKTYQEQLEYQATCDSLTGLTNRNLLNDRLDQAIRSAQRHQNEICIFFLDLDNFKVINDTLGHSAGDELLKVIAQRLQKCARAEDTIARYSGDEFVFVTPQIAKMEDAVLIAERLIAEISQPLQIKGHKIQGTASIGISFYPHDGLDKETLLQHADTAMYHAKDKGRNTFCFYTEELNLRLMQRLTLEGDLRQALKHEQFKVFYQPKFDLHTGTISGVEALLRWYHPEKGMIPPDQFIPFAEDTGLILPIGEWVLRTACIQAKAWHDAGLPDISVAVNVSPKQLHVSNFTKMICDVLKDSGLDACYLDLELTEGAVMREPEKMVQTLTQLKAIGVQISMDDFGTGYSSLSYLKRFPFDNLKIDKAFIKDIPDDQGDVTLVLTIIAMAHNFKLKVIAEGVETQAQMDFLKLKKCNVIQGYFFSRPLPAHELEKLLRKD
ncbi:MAG: EAL domain-containing protein [Methylococcaceae bacterium]|nr:EAL domain-containing protein [Methylococcaceae bacterium]